MLKLPIIPPIPTIALYFIGIYIEKYIYIYHGIIRTLENRRVDEMTFKLHLKFTKGAKEVVSSSGN